MGYKRLDVKTLIDYLGDIIVWLGERSPTATDRIRAYRDNMVEMVEKNSRLDAAQVYAEIDEAGRATEILSSYVEGIEFADAIRTLREHDVRIPRDCLERIRLGPTDAAKEDEESNRARNLMFELIMAAMFASGGCKPTLGKGSEPDITATFEDRRVMIECKRVMSARAIWDRLDDAMEQLSRKVRRKDNDCGLVAISISRVFSVGDRFYEVPTLASAEEFVANQIRSIITELAPKLETISKATTSAIVFHMTLPLHVTGLGFTPAKDAIVYRMTSNVDPAFLTRLMKRLRP